MAKRSSKPAPKPAKKSAPPKPARAQVALPPMDPFVTVADPHKPGRRHMSLDDRDRRRNAVAGMLRDNAPVSQIYAYTRQVWAIGRRATRRLIDDIFSEWSAYNRSADLARERERHARRAENHVRLLMSPSKVDQKTGQRITDVAKVKWSAVAQMETLIGRIRGTIQPDEEKKVLNVDVAMAQVIAGMSAEQLDQMAAQQLELERKAEERDRLVVDAPKPSLQLVKPGAA